MPNHVHLVMTPETPDGLSRAVGEAHRRYTGFVNTRLRAARDGPSVSIALLIGGDG